MTVSLLLCVNDSDESRHAIVEAARLFPGARAVVISVYKPYEAVAGGYALAGIAGDGRVLWDERSDAARKDSHDIVHEATALAESHGLGAEPAPRAMETTVWQSIIDAAHDRGADLIVTGGRGLSGLHELVDGSLSHRLIQHSDTPVLVIPRPDHDAEA